MPKGTARLAALLAIVAVGLCAPDAAHAQAVKYLFEIGGKFLSIALEKKGELTVGIAAAAVWDGTKGAYGQAFAAGKKDPAKVSCTVEGTNVIDCEGLGKVTLNIGKPATPPASKDMPVPVVAPTPATKDKPLEWSDFAGKSSCDSYASALFKDGCKRGLVNPHLFVTVTPPTQPPPSGTAAPVAPGTERTKAVYSLPALKMDTAMLRFIAPAEAAVPPKPIQTPEISVLTFSGGTVYHGEIANGKPNGRGELREPNGTIIAATFANGIATGVGTYRTRAGLTVQDAHFQDGHLVGLYLCNGTDSDKFAAYAHKANFGWMAEGWLKLAPGHCGNPVAAALPGRNYFLRFEDDKGAAVYADTHRSFCVSSAAFQTVDRLSCPPGSEKRGFARERAINGGLLFELLPGD